MCDINNENINKLTIKDFVGIWIIFFVLLLPYTEHLFFIILSFCAFMNYCLYDRLHLRK